MNENNNGEAPTMAPGTNNRVNNVVSTISHIPLPQWKVAVDSRYQNSEMKWKAKFEETEKRRKSLLTQTQKNERDLADLERRYQLLHNECNSLQKQLADKDTNLAQLQAVSEKVYREYEVIKNKHDVQSRVMEDTMKSASQWYFQNRELKRMSAAIAQKCSKEATVTLDEPDVVTSTDGDLDNLMQTIKELTDQVGHLQAELNSARLQEFEAQENAVSLAGELEEERSLRLQAETELQELRMMRNNLDRVSRLVATEMTALREQCQQEKEEAQRMKFEADKAQKERNVLKHQSTLLLADIVKDEKMMHMVQEVEVLKRTLEEEQQRHMTEIQELQDKLEERETEPCLELVEEKLRLAESELQLAVQRAEQAEKRTMQLNSKVSQLQEKLEAKACPPPPPPPPIPPPLPPPKSLLKPHTVTVASATDTGADVGTGNPVLDMANMLGISRKPAAVSALPSAAIDDIVNQIKRGKFTLRATEKQRQKKEETPEAVQEMLTILGTLKRRPRNSAQISKWPPHADVAL
jgi:chromosome segregation ATPase